MERIVFCKKYKEELPGLDNPPYPGPKGQEIFLSVSRRAWEEWLNHQTMLINEGKLNLQEKKSRAWLNGQMELFLTNGDYSIPKGFKDV
tara:strand:- start:2085 stop:2351 length:267 start_codon:yes stop_codon:yes gene_type:complete